MIKRYWVFSQVQVNDRPADEPESKMMMVFNNGMGIELPYEISEFKHVDPGVAKIVQQTLAQTLKIPDPRCMIVNILSFSPLADSFADKFLGAGR